MLTGTEEPGNIDAYGVFRRELAKASRCELILIYVFMYQNALEDAD